MSEVSINKQKMPKSFLGKVLRVLGGYEIAIISMFLLLLLTFFCTFEQVESGLYWTLKKYFSPEHAIVRPFLDGRDAPILLPGGYWVCVVFTVNLVIGGLLRARKGLKQIPILVSHMCMVFIMVAGAVGYHQSKEALILLENGTQGDVAKSFYEESIEIFEVVDGKKTTPTVINSEVLKSVRGEPEARREFLLPDFPFDVEVSGYFTSARISNDITKAGMNPIVDGVFLEQTRANEAEELNQAGCYVKVTDKKTGEKRLLVLAESAPNYITLTIEDKIYGFQMVPEIWPLPFTIKLNNSKGENYPNTQRPKTYESFITVIDEAGKQQDAHIKMNEPLRYEGLTTYQTKWFVDDEGKTFSGFTVKKNPSDQWPKIAIYISGIALAVHFLMKLTMFISNRLGGARREQ